jgi:hypothetical protein
MTQERRQASLTREDFHLQNAAQNGEEVEKDTSKKKNSYSLQWREYLFGLVKN